MTYRKVATVRGKATITYWAPDIPKKVQPKPDGSLLAYALKTMRRRLA